MINKKKPPDKNKEYKKDQEDQVYKIIKSKY